MKKRVVDDGQSERVTSSVPSTALLAFLVTDRLYYLTQVFVARLVVSRIGEDSDKQEDSDKHE